MKDAELDKMISMTARLASGRPAFLGWILGKYQASEGLNDAALSKLLGIGADVLPSLCLCLRPREGEFMRDIDEISGKLKCDADALVAIVRHVDFLVAAGSAGNAGGTGRLLAARSRKQGKPGRGKKGAS